MRGVELRPGWIRAIVLLADVADRTGTVYTIEALRALARQAPRYLRVDEEAKALIYEGRGVAGADVPIPSMGGN